MLLDLPPELLGLMLSTSEHSFLVLPLIKCGNSQLTQRLLHSVSMIDLEDMNPKSMSRFPRILPRFVNLRSIRIARKFNDMRSPRRDILEEMARIPREKLETLELRSDRWEPLFKLPFDLHAPIEPSSVPKIPLAIHPTFPALTTLSLLAGSGLPDFMAFLPPTLTCLETSAVHVYDFDDPSLYFSALPRPLLIWRTKIKFGIEVNESAVTLFRDPPPGLHTISALHFNDGVASLACLPPTLTSCLMRNLSYSPALVRTLPPGLHLADLSFSLDGSSVELESIASWPPLLKTLSIEKYSPLISDAQVLSKLPPALTELSLLPYDSWDLSREHHGNFTFWPSTLSTLNLHQVSSTTFEYLLSLPRTLTSLSLSWSGKSFPVELLPLGLISLSISLIALENFTIKSDRLKSLEILRLTSESLDRNEFFELTASLPPSLLELDIVPFIMETTSPSGQWIVPTFHSGLRKLHIHRWRIPHFKDLPASLTDLCVKDVPLSINAMIPKDTDVFAGLPVGLKRLYLGAFSANTETWWPSCSFASLQSLTLLHVRELGFFDPSTLRHLPASLRDLYIFLTHNGPEDEDAIQKRVPKTLIEVLYGSQ